MMGDRGAKPAPRAGRRQAAPQNIPGRLLCREPGRTDHHPHPWLRAGAKR